MKNAFGNFAYDFELSHKNEILACARTKSANADEIFGFASDEIKSTHPASSRISSNEVGFHRCRRFHTPARVDLVEKPTSQNLSVFLAGMARFERLRLSFASQNPIVFGFAEGVRTSPLINILTTKKRPTQKEPVVFWQGWRGSNSRMTESKSGALPLGYIPILK